MYLKWGEYSFQTRKTWLDWVYTPVFSQRGYLMFYRLAARFGGTASITGAETVSDLETKMTALEAAMLLQNKDFGLYHEGTDAASLHRILASDTMDGTQMQFGWLKGTARAIRGNSNEYINLRTYQGMVSCTINACEEEIVAWDETIRQVGNGGIGAVMQESLTGVPQQQLLQVATKVLFIQEGHAVGWSGWPEFPDVIFPNNLNVKDAIYERGAPVYGRNLIRLFPIRWRYPQELDINPGYPIYPSDPPALSDPTP